MKSKYLHSSSQGTRIELIKLKEEHFSYFKNPPIYPLSKPALTSMYNVYNIKLTTKDRNSNLDDGVLFEGRGICCERIVRW